MIIQNHVDSLRSSLNQLNKILNNYFDVKLSDLTSIPKETDLLNRGYTVWLSDMYENLCTGIRKLIQKMNQLNMNELSDGEHLTYPLVIAPESKSFKDIQQYIDIQESMILAKIVLIGKIFEEQGLIKEDENDN